MLDSVELRAEPFQPVKSHIEVDVHRAVLAHAALIVSRRQAILRKRIIKLTQSAERIQKGGALFPGQMLEPDQSHVVSHLASEFEQFPAREPQNRSSG